MKDDGLIAELCRRFNSKRPAMMCALSHSQVTVDGHVMKVEFDKRWAPERLRGRYATMIGRTARLYSD